MWINIENIVGKWRQAQRTTHLFEMSRTGRCLQTGVQCLLEAGEKEVYGVTNGYRVSFGVMKIFWDYLMVIGAQFSEYIKNQ